MVKLNEDCWSYIFGCCNYDDIKNIVLICKKFNEIIKTNKYIYYLSKNNKNNLLKTVCNNYIDNNILNLSINYINIIKLLLKYGADPTYDWNILIITFCIKGNIELVKLLLENSRVDPSIYNNYCIMMASERGHTEIVKILLKDNRVNPAIKNNYPIKTAKMYGHQEIVNLLIEDGRSSLVI